jgi:chromatin segregation and condensation protein Rec8/ScpA/Scc1 (kleisin family)
VKDIIENIIGDSEKMHQIFETIEKVTEQVLVDPNTRQKVGKSENEEVILEQIDAFVEQMRGGELKWVKGTGKDAARKVAERFAPRLMEMRAERDRKIAAGHEACERVLRRPGLRRGVDGDGNAGRIEGREVRPAHDVVEMEMGEEKVDINVAALGHDGLAEAAQALKEIPKELFYEVVKDEFTIEDKVHQILHLLVEKPRMLISELFSQAKNKLEIIANFLAILELIRLKEIVAVQKALFREIEITRNKENILPYERRTEEKS